ncbi:endonuclease/exonuclease/phosphatase family protein [Cystobacter fuscus]
MGLHLAFGPNVERAGRRYGNAILSRLPILRSRNYDLSVGDNEPRGALRCDLDLGGGQQLHLFCLHLGLGIRERRRQESLLLSSDILRDAVRSVPLVVCGDFNYWGPGAVRGRRVRPSTTRPWSWSAVIAPSPPAFRCCGWIASTWTRA